MPDMLCVGRSAKVSAEENWNFPPRYVTCAAGDATD
jgi:hypothetical protein